MIETQTSAGPVVKAAKDTIPTVSIGMPVYNGAKYIHEALDSLLSQTFTDFELIISDNASTDGTQAICVEYARLDPRIRYVRQSENKGALANFQFVLDKARGKYFMWAAYDDKWDRNWIVSLKNLLESSGSGAAFGKLMHIDENSRPFPHPANGKTFEFTGSLIRRRVGYFTEFERYGKANPIYSLFRRDVLRDIKLETYSADFHMVFAILRKTELRPAPQTILYKRLHSSGSSGAREASGLSVTLRRLLYLLNPVEVGFVAGYFRHGSNVERLLFVILLPKKMLLGYMFNLDSLMLMIKSKYFDSGKTHSDIDP